MLRFLIGLLAGFCAWSAWAQTPERVVDIPTRPGVTQRLLVLQAPEPKATVLLFAGGHGGLQIQPDGSLRWGANNFLVRTRSLFHAQGFNVVVLDAPSDRGAPGFMNGQRQRPEHAADVKAVIAWARSQSNAPVWLVGTSRGTQSVGYLATELTGPEGPDGIVLTATIVSDDRGRAVPAMPLGQLRIPTLLVHHEQDGCSHCAFAGTQQVMDKLSQAPRKQLIAISGGRSVGDPCEAMAYHGFNGMEQPTVQQIGAWMLAKP